MNGDQIVVPESLRYLLADSKYHEYAVLILHWLIPELYKELKDELKGVKVEVVKIEYLGAYPALGLQSETINPYNSRLDELVETTVEKLLRDKSIIEIIDFMTTDDVDWKDVTNNIMRKI